jgi:large subunit ribosomal protein L5
MSERDTTAEGSKLNPMLKPRIEKVTVNICVGESGANLEKAVKILKQLTGQNPCQKNAKKSVREFGIRKGEPIACMVTLRGSKAFEFLRKVLDVAENKLSESAFDKFGNFGFGIKEHIEIAGTKYIPELGIVGMDISVSFIKPGVSISRRRIMNRKLKESLRPTPKETMAIMKEQFGVTVVSKVI